MVVEHVAHIGCGDAQTPAAVGKAMARRVGRQVLVNAGEAGYGFEVVVYGGGSRLHAGQ
jgi:hypothetical protein